MCRPTDEPIAGSHSTVIDPSYQAVIGEQVPPRDEDLLTLLREDHERIRGLLALLATADPLEQPAVRGRLAAVVNGHEAAEELVLYPVVRDELQEGAETAVAALVEQSNISELVVSLESIAWWDGAEFADAVNDLSRALSDHCSWEESVVFPMVARNVLPYRRFMMGARYLEVNSSGPTLAARALRRAM